MLNKALLELVGSDEWHLEFLGTQEELKTVLKTIKDIRGIDFINIENPNNPLDKGNLTIRDYFNPELKLEYLIKDLENFFNQEDRLN